MTTNIKSLRISTPFVIIGGEIVYDDATFPEKLARLRGNEGAHGDCVYEITDDVRYSQHKYLWGFVYPVIAEAQGERDINVVHRDLKITYGRREIVGRTFSEIPQRYLNKRTTFVDESRIMEWAGVGTAIILHDREPIAYVPSNATLTVQEMRAYILRCEEIRDGMIDWVMPQEAKLYRRRAFGKL
jgi:hypothetical protein